MTFLKSTATTAVLRDNLVHFVTGRNFFQPKKSHRKVAFFVEITKFDYRAAFFPSLYMYKVISGFFNSPFGSKPMALVTPLKLDLINSGP